MKKLFVTTILIISFFSLQAQVKFGFKAAPQLSFNRIQSGSDAYDIENDGSSIKLLLGPTFDFPFRENHYFSTGLFFNGKQAAFIATDKNNREVSSENYNLQYLQIPFTLKLFTEEIGLDKKLYFQFGGTTDIRLQGILSNDNLLNQVHFFDLSALLAAGMEYRIGLKTKLFAGLYYNRGLLNTVSQTRIEGEWRLNNDTVGLEIGVIF